ncbi:MAG: Spo0B domain-containing protein [Clostridiales bacterium]|nr:Spo0B domain-containing protein [Clostridiales bacterium]MCF8021494.1 Spo0B domain-containing protein [Clostridiales bacterium]
MDAYKYMELISYLRHNFLNHLQVLSGYIQLGKNEKALQYLQKVNVDFKKLTGIVHLDVPEVAGAFLAGEEMAASVQAETSYNVQCDLKGCTIPGPASGRAVLDCMRVITDCMASGPYNEKQYLWLEIYVKEKNNKYCLSFNFISPRDVDDLIISFNKINNELSLHGGYLKWEFSQDGSRLGQVEIFLSYN